MRSKRPIKIVYCEKYKILSEARNREVEIKRWKRKYKLLQISKNYNFIPVSVDYTVGKYKLLSFNRSSNFQRLVLDD